MSASSPPIWRFQGKRSSPPSISCPGELTHHSENSASPKASRCPLAEVYSLAEVCSTAQLSQRINFHPEIQETQCGSPCDPNGEALPRVSRLSGCVISGINTAVFVSPHSAPGRAAARPAACSWSLAPWHRHHQGPEKAPPHGHRALDPGSAVWRPLRCRCYNPRRGSEHQETSRPFPFGMRLVIIGRTT